MQAIFGASVFLFLAEARGTGNGFSKENAAEVDLIPGTLKLFTYNVNSAGEDMLNGELQLTRTANFDDKNLEYKRYV